MKNRSIVMFVACIQAGTQIIAGFMDRRLCWRPWSA